MKWTKTGQGGVYHKFRWGFVSYIPDTSILRGTSPFGLICELASVICDEEEGEETALKLKDGKWRILEGDFRKEYAGCKTADEAMKVYKNHIDKRKSGFCTDGDEFEEQ